MKAYEVQECMRTGYERKFLITLTNCEELMDDLELSLNKKLINFSERAGMAILQTLRDRYAIALEREADGTLTITPNNGKPTPDFSRGWNVWHLASEKNNTLGHPAPFPLTLAKDHILSWSNPGDLVLDPFAGSGTTLLAAKQLNRNYVGIEKESIYKTMCDQRVSSFLG